MRLAFSIPLRFFSLPATRKGAWGEGEITVHNFAISPNTVIASEAKQSMAPQKQVWIASSQVLLAMTVGHTFAISQAAAPRVLLLFPALSELRAQGMPGVRCAR